MNNKELYHYGKRARQKQKSGYFAVVFYGFIGIMILLIGLNSAETVNGKIIVGVVGGVFLVLAGYSMKALLNADAERHDYKMRSGTIIYGEED